MKRTVSFLLSLIMVIGIITSVPVTVSAASSGTHGDNITWTIDDAGVLIISGTGDMYEDEYGALPSWYSYREKVNKIVIDYGVTNICSHAFLSFENLTSITIPDSVTSIGDDAFAYCSKLSDIIIPDSVKSIGEDAFLLCLGLTDIRIPGSVKTIGESAFRLCENLETVEICDGVTSIGDYAFIYCSSLTNITIPDSITSIGEQAFGDCMGLTTVTIPDSVTSLGYSPFSYCTNLVSIDVDENNPKYCSDDGVLFDKNKTSLIQYPAMKPGEAYTIPDSVKKIADYAFYFSSNLASVTIPDGVTNIGNLAFAGSVGLKSIFIPSTVTSIGLVAFCCLGDFDSINVDADNPNYCSVAGVLFNKNKSELMQYPSGKKALSYDIPDGVVTISRTAFGYAKINTVTIPGSVKTIVDYAFGETDIKDVYYNGSKSQWGKIDIARGNESLTGAIIHFAETDAVPTTPKPKSVSNAIDGVKVVWNAVDDADEYIVYRKTAKSGWANLGTTAETTFTDKTAKSGTTYYYTVKAQNGAGASGYNKTGLAIKYLSAPKLSKVYNNGAGNVLSWGKVTGASGYYVYRKTPSSGWSKVATIKKGTTASYTDKKVTYGKTYIYTVKAYSGKTTSSFNTNGVTILKKIPNVTITTKNVNGGKKVSLSSSISGATIYYKTSKDGKYKKYTGEFGLTSTKTIYAYAVRSGYYKSSTASKKITVTKVKTPSVVVKNCVGGKKISFTSGTSGATFYYKTSKNGSYVKYTEPFTLTSTKTIYVKAYKPGYATSSTASKKVSVSKIGTPTGLVVKSYASTSTKISWKKVTGAQGYFIYRATEKDGPYTLVHTIKSGTTVSKTDTGLEPTTTYYYKVRAYCSGKASSSYTAVAGAITKATPTTTDAKKFFNGLNGIWGGAYLKLFAKPGDKDFKYDTIFCMKYHTYDFYSNQTSYKSYLTLSSTGKKSTVKISSIMSEAEYKKYINRKNYDHWRVYKVSDLQAILDKTWAPGTFKVKDWADGKDHIVTSKGYFLMNMPDRGLDAADVVTEIKSCEKVDGKFYLEVYMLNYDFWGERIYDVSTGNYATVNGYGYELTSVEQFCADAGITKDQLGTVTVVIKETSSGLRLESMS